MRNALTSIALLLVLATASSASAQTPDADWKTVETEHFRVYFPSDYEEWAREIAGKLEPIRERLIVEIGFAPSGKTDVLVMDPEAVANGSAWPLLTSPRMVLWTSPPGPESTIGHYSSWTDLLAVHEYAHVVHLLRPSRSPMQRVFERLLPLGPIGLESPRWVSEGYATVVEGDVTGAGRPNSDLRAAILRRWALVGRLPSYGQLQSDSENWLGMSMAYLTGSAYLEWLRDHEGPESLRNLWMRMTARKPRSFDDAFEGVYGEPPKVLYGRFSAELTHRALAIEANRASSVRQGELWQDLRWTTEQPVVSPDGKTLLTVERHQEDPSELVVLSTESDENDRKKRDEKIRKTLERDPEDVAPVLRKPVKREPLYSLKARSTDEDFLTPRWMPDSKELLFSRFEPDSQGIMHPDLFLWELMGGVARLTWQADVRDADPAPDGKWAVAVRHRFGASQLVRIDLGSGEITEMTPASVRVVYDHPRISPDGSRIAFVRHQEGSWKLFLRDVSSAAEQELRIPGARLIAQPEWSRAGDALFTTVGINGFIEILRVPIDGSSTSEVTRSQGASLAPAPGADSLYFLSLEPDGFDIRRLPLNAIDVPLPPFSAGVEQWPLAGPPRGKLQPLLSSEIGPTRDYGAGRQEYSLILGGTYAKSANLLEAGLRIGDVVGRLDTLLVGSFGGDRGPEGAAAALAWRGWPIELSGHFFTADERFGASALFSERSGGELAATWDAESRYRDTAVDAGTLLQRSGGENEEVLFADFSHEAELPRGDNFAAAFIDMSAHTGRRAGETWTRLQGQVGVSAGAGGTALQVSYGLGSGDGEPGEPLFALGGIGSTIVPESAWSGRVLEPAVEVGTLVGSEYEQTSAELQLGLPLSAFYQRYRFWDDGSRGDWFDLAGLRMTLPVPPMPLLQLPAFNVQLGVARTLDEPLKNKTRWWFGLVFRP